MHNHQWHSFHPVKHIAAGEGGMVLTNRKDVYEELMLFRTHGITKDPSGGASLKIVLVLLFVPQIQHYH